MTGSNRPSAIDRARRHLEDIQGRKLNLTLDRG